MPAKSVQRRRTLLRVAIAAFALMPVAPHGQGQAGQQRPSPSPRELAPVDLTGY